VTDPLAFEFLIDPAETYRANRIILGRGWRRYLTALPWVGLAGLVVYALAMGLPRSDYGILWRAFGLLTVLYLGAPFVERWLLRRQDRKSAFHKVVIRFELSRDALTMSGGPHTTTLPWPGIVEAMETEEFFLFFVRKNFAFSLPKRAIAPPDLEAARSLLRAVLGIRATVSRAFERSEAPPPRSDTAAR
jgi:hypothetical protein